ncbi:hypothetical protein FA13DRAFT_1732982 [Coprinellus micaceus]|uniref:Uncharacterized protein n=1 Tax=Coprinellus micaceus TaxID=71717 RepID=A0A4Y7TAK9_COPMI|nr:hypothetical protein FA13DRAFT_1732982 [Coprinellus micaceus]
MKPEGSTTQPALPTPDEAVRHFLDYGFNFPPTLEDLAFSSFPPCTEFHNAVASLSDIALDFCPIFLDWVNPYHRPCTSVGPSSEETDALIRCQTYTNPWGVFTIVVWRLDEDTGRWGVVAQVGVKRKWLLDREVKDSWVEENSDGGVLGFRGLLASSERGGAWLALERCEDLARGERYWRVVDRESGWVRRL